MSILAQLVIALAIFAAGTAGGIKWQLGVQARIELAAKDARDSDLRQQRIVVDKASAAHASTLEAINEDLGEAREQIARLSGRECLDSRTVRMLNNIGQPNRTPAGQPESAPEAPATGQGIRFATDADAASAIAVCYARYAEVSSQVNQILDIEEKRFPPPK